MYTEERPWGSFTILEEKDNYKVKRIIVNPSQRLSYQSHKKREEYWTIVEGTAKVVLNGKNYFLKYGESIFIGKEQKHRIENISESQMSFIEVQTGDYFGEDDIERYEDDYNRS